jgi:hypothetical protein
MLGDKKTTQETVNIKKVSYVNGILNILVLFWLLHSLGGGGIVDKNSTKRLKNR